MRSSASDLLPATTPPLFEIVAEELSAHGWPQRQFARILGKPVQAVNGIVRAKKQISPETALRIAAALGTSPELWIGLEADYRLSIARRTLGKDILDEIADRSTQLQVEPS